MDPVLSGHVRPVDAHDLGNADLAARPGPRTGAAADVDHRAGPGEPDHPGHHGPRRRVRRGVDRGDGVVVGGRVGGHRRGQSGGCGLRHHTAVQSTSWIGRRDALAPAGSRRPPAGTPRCRRSRRRSRSRRVPPGARGASSASIVDSYMSPSRRSTAMGPTSVASFGSVSRNQPWHELAPGRRAGRSGRSWPAPPRARRPARGSSWSRIGTSTGNRSASASGSPSNESQAHTVRWPSPRAARTARM